MKKIFIILISMMLFIPTCFAIPDTKSRSDLENYGVNKKWKVTKKNIDNVLNTHYVDVFDKIYDFSDVLNEDEENTLRDLIEQFEIKTGYALVILIDDLPYSDDKQNEDYAADFYDYNDFGIDIDNYSGILLFRNTYEIDPYYDMYMFGDAQLYFNQQRCDVILDGIYDDLHSKNYIDGISLFIDYVDESISKGIPESNENLIILKSNGKVIEKYSVPYFIIIVCSCVVTIIIMLILRGKNKNIIKATTAFPYLFEVNFTKKTDKLISSHVSKHYISSSSSSGGSHSSGSFHSSSGSSGGFHSSGGGRHG